MSPPRGVSNLAWFTSNRSCLAIQREHLYVAHPLLKLKHIAERFTLKALLEPCTHSWLDTFKHTFGNSLPLIPPMATKSAGPSWQPLWSSPNVAMAYVHNCREWRMLLQYHVDLQLPPGKKKRFLTDSCCGKTNQQTSETELPPQTNTRSQNEGGRELKCRKPSLRWRWWGWRGDWAGST